MLCIINTFACIILAFFWALCIRKTGPKERRKPTLIVVVLLIALLLYLNISAFIGLFKYGIFRLWNTFAAKYILFGGYPEYQIALLAANVAVALLVFPRYHRLDRDK